MGWALSIFLNTDSCIEALEKALLNGRPEIINSDQGCQFTSDMWINFLQQESIKISMDGKGRWADNIYIERLWRAIKYELVYLHSFENVQGARKAISQYIIFYNQQRPHQALNYQTPSAVYKQKIIPSKKELFNGFINQQKTLIQEDVMYS
jgi:putative transposase